MNLYDRLVTDLTKYWHGELYFWKKLELPNRLDDAFESIKNQSKSIVTLVNEHGKNVTLAETLWDEIITAVIENLKQELPRILLTQAYEEANCNGFSYFPKYLERREQYRD